MNSPLKGKTYEEVYGLEEATRQKLLRKEMCIDPESEYSKKRKKAKIFNNSCKFCGLKFDSIGKSRIYCSVSCRAKGDNPGSSRKDKTLVEIYGKERADKIKSSCSISNMGKENHNRKGRGKGGYREDLGHFVRSTWEANFARVLNYFGVLYEYEPVEKRIYFGHCSYLPDFYIPESGFLIEVKGGSFNDRGKKLELLYEKDPNFPIKILDGEGYKILSKKYKNIVPTWES
jgi:hypothetical protein